MPQVIGKYISIEEVKKCRKELGKTLNKYGFTDGKFRGKTILEIESGGVRSIEQHIRYS